MIDTSQDILQQYMSGLRGYLTAAGEAALQTGYELGRRAIADGLGALDMLAIHQKCLASALRGARSAEEFARRVEQAGNFFSESLSPFEMSLRGFQEANARLSRNLEELRVAEAELLKQHNQLLAAHHALESERRRYQDLFDFAPDGYLVTDLEGKIEEANRAAESLLGMHGEFLTGTRLLQFVAEQSRADFEARRKRLLEEKADKAQDWQFNIQPQKGTAFPATLSVRAVRNAAGPIVGLRWLLRDVTERKRIEEERAQLLVREQVARAQSEAARRFAFLAEISSLLMASLDAETTINEVACHVVPYLADWCLAYVVEQDQGMIRLLCAVPGDAQKTHLAGQLSREPATLHHHSRVARVLRDVSAEIIDRELETRPEETDGEPVPFSFLLEQGLKSFMLVPIGTNRRFLGLMVLASVQPSRYGDSDLRLAEDLARRCALAVDNAWLYRAMTAERDKAAEASRAKDEFLGILGHELRNPLVPILGWARNLKKNPAVSRDQVLSQGCEAMERNARHILRLADDCLDLVRISERKVTLEREHLDLNQSIQSCTEALSQAVQEKGLRVVTRLSSSSLYVVGDRVRLAQVMNNLLMNAVKYTESGGSILIRSSVVENNAEITVQDTGIGIAPEFLDKVFQPFHRGSKEWLTSDAGLGLGLAIARKIVELHDGTVRAESPGPGRGSTFQVRLPLAPKEISTSAPSIGPSRAPEKAGSLRILVIDDHKDVADLIKLELEDLGYSVLTAADGRAGLEAAVKAVPDVIVSDVKMPRMDGYELIQRLRRTPNLTAVPVIALTGFGMKKDVEAAIAAGYDAHLTKPVEVNQLSDLIQQLAARLRP